MQKEYLTKINTLCDKNIQKPEVLGGNFLKIIKGIYEKNIILNSKNGNILFSIKIRNKTKMLTFTIAVQNYIGSSTQGNYARKKFKKASKLENKSKQ